MQLDDMILISTDDHVVEPANMFDGHVPAKYRTDAPKIVRSENGSEAWMFQGREAGLMGMNAVVAGPKAEWGYEPSSFAEMRPGVYDVHERVRDMNRNGIVSSMCFPTFGGFNGGAFNRADDKDLSLVMIKAYNDWHIDEWAATYPGRFIPLAILPIWSPEEMVREIKRVSAKGCTAVSFPELPHMDGRPSYHDLDYWGHVFQALSEEDIPMCMHIGQGLFSIQMSPDAPMDNQLIVATQVSAIAAQDLLFGPALRAYPDLRLCWSEAGIGWISYFLDRCDRHYTNQEWLGQDFGDKLPSELFRERSLACYVTDPTALKVRHEFGIDSIAWECDYPHSDSIWPDAPEFVLAELNAADVPDDEIDKITWANAARFLRFDPFAHISKESASVGALRTHATDVDTSTRARKGWAELSQRAPGAPRAEVISAGSPADHRSWAVCVSRLSGDGCRVAPRHKTTRNTCREPIVRSDPMAMQPITTPSSATELSISEHPTIADSSVLDATVIIRPSTQSGVAPIRIGFLSDLPSGEGLAKCLDPIVLAIEDAMLEGRLERSVELLATHARGLPYGTAETVVAAFRDLVDRGCAIVLSTGVTNNALVLRDVINETQVPYISMAGTTKFVGEFCFLLPNGGHSEEAAIVAGYLADQGLRRIVLTGEGTEGDVEYREFFEEQASLYGLEIIETYYFSNDPTDEEVDTALERFRALEPDALAYCGFGINTKQFGLSLKRIGWDPPRAMNTAILWAFSGQEWADALDGWVGIDQVNNDHDDVERNRNYAAMLGRYEKRFGDRRDSTMTALFYDQGRCAAEAIINAPTADGPGLKAGLERIAMMPSTLGGPRTYIGFGPNDHRGYRGDFMFMKQLRDGKFHFVSYHWPQWPANHAD